MDSELNAQTFQRNIRTLWNGLCITLDYKLFFHPGADVNTIHQRVAERILYTCQKNAYVEKDLLKLETLTCISQWPLC